MYNSNNNQQPPTKKHLRQVQYHGIGDYHQHHAFCVSTNTEKIILGSDERSFQELQGLFAPSLANNTQVVGVTVITECQENDHALSILGATALREARSIFPGKNIVIGMSKNPYVTRDASSAPLKCAEALFSGWTMFYCNQSNVLGAASKRAIFSLSINLDATGKKYSKNESHHTNSSYPGCPMFNVQDDVNGRRLIGSELIRALLDPFIGKDGYVVASCFGIAQKPSSTDSSGEIIPQKPSIKFSFHDNVRINNQGEFRLLQEGYHGLLMAHPYLINSQLELSSSSNTPIFSQNSAVAQAFRAAFNEIMLPDPLTLNIGMLTTNKKKVIEIRNILEKLFARINKKHNGSLSKFKLIVEQIKFLRMIEEQILDPAECTESKIDQCRLTVEQLSAALGRSCIFIDDTSFAVEALDMQPGPFFKQHYDKGEADSKTGKGLKYNNFICQAVNAYAKQQSLSGNKMNIDENEFRKAWATTIFACILSTPWGTAYESLFRSSVVGIIPDAPRALDFSKEFGWDPIFVPLETEQEDTPGQLIPGSGKTYQQMNDNEIALSKPRGFALSKLLTALIFMIKGTVVPPEEYDFGLTIAEQKESTERMQAAMATASSLVQTGHISVANNNNNAVNQSVMVAAAGGGVSVEDIFASFR